MVGTLRWLNHVHELSLNLRDFPLHVFVQIDDWAIDEGKARDVALARSPDYAPDTLEILARDADAKIPPVQSRVSGHDVIAAIRLTSAGWSDRPMSVHEVITGFHVGCTCDRVATLPVVQAVAVWGTRRGHEIWSCPH
ncbi:MAG: hypothetical protein O3B31_02675 [Chloroflexi bacterium]|nr:hypothetical protein [Chloroflexota bacterium]